MTGSDYLVNLARRGAGLAPETTVQPSVSPAFSPGSEPLWTSEDVSKEPGATTELPLESASTPAAASEPVVFRKETASPDRVSSSPPSLRPSPPWNTPLPSTPSPRRSSESTDVNPGEANSIVPPSPIGELASQQPPFPDTAKLASVEPIVPSNPAIAPQPGSLQPQMGSVESSLGEDRSPRPLSPPDLPIELADAIPRPTNRLSPASLPSDQLVSPIAVTPATAVERPQPMPPNNPAAMRPQLAHPPQAPDSRKSAAPPVQVRIGRIEVRMTAPPPKPAPVTPSKSRNLVRNFDQYAAARRYVDRIWY